MTPSKSPTTSLPTAAPSITGSVAILELTKTVIESIPESNVTDVQNEVATKYGVNTEDVIVEVVYQTTGTLDIAITDDTVTEEELEEALEDQIAALLGIHEGNAQVNITDGVVYYTVTSDSAELAQSLQDVLEEPTSADAISEAVPEADVNAVNVDDEIMAEMIVTVDTTGTDNNLEDAAAALEENFEDQGYNTETESNTNIV